MYITCIHATPVPKTNYNKTESVELYVPRLNEKIIGKTFVSRCGLTVPRGCVEIITPFSYLRELRYNFLLNGSLEQYGDMDEGEIEQSY